MAARADVTPNRRGLKSRELVLDAAERVMAEHGFEAATIARVVEEAGIPLSSVYHYYGSKDGILLAVMERGAERFADMPVSQSRTGRPAQHLAGFISRAAETLERHPDFLRLLIVFAAQPPAGAGGELEAVVGRIRGVALERLRRRDRQRLRRRAGQSGHRDRLARFALAAFDGAFVASRADGALGIEALLRPLAPALVAARRSLIAEA